MRSWIGLAALALASPAMIEPQAELMPTMLSVTDDIPTERILPQLSGTDSAMLGVDMDSGLPPLSRVGEIEVIDCYVDLWSDGRPIMAARKR